jgi:hypothetical protein
VSFKNRRVQKPAEIFKVRKTKFKEKNIKTY